MSSLINCENYKLLKSKSLKIITIISTLFFIVFINNKINDSPENIYFLDSIKAVTIGFDYFIIMLSIFCANYTAGEFEYNTIRNSMSVGKSRIHYLFAKFYVQMIVSVTIFITTLVTSSIFFYVKVSFNYTPTYNDIFISFISILTNIWFLMVYNSIFLMFSFCIRDIGSTIIISVFFCISDSFLPTFLLFFKNPVMETLSKYTLKTLRTTIYELNLNNFNVSTIAPVFIIPLIISIISLLVAINNFKYNDI